LEFKIGALKVLIKYLIFATLIQTELGIKYVTASKTNCIVYDMKKLRI
jgi:hypothetical protein